jgi:transcription elongation GreA/GreB family factor
MSRAFVKESDGAEALELPNRPVSDHPNLVTAAGLAQMDEALARLHAAHARAQTAGDRSVLAGVGRDLRYWTARRSSAQLVPPPASNDKVQFGSTVTILRDDGRRQTWRLVGEDEAEPAKGTLSYMSPVARALMNKQVGDVIVAGSGEGKLWRFARSGLIRAMARLAQGPGYFAGRGATMSRAPAARIVRHLLFTKQ